MMMKKLKKLASGGVLLAGLAYALTAYAYPMPGEAQEVYVTYYSNSSRTTVVGVRGISRGSLCEIYHSTWGSTTGYSSVTVGNCIPRYPE